MRKVIMEGFITPDRQATKILKRKGPSKGRRRQSQLAAADRAAPADLRRRNRANLFDLAYERIEELIVNCELQPGRFLTMQDLQEATGFGRTPVHQAVNRLTADTLIIVLPRHGVQIAPIDLARERVLLRLRGDIERFVIRLAAERSKSSQHNQMLHLARALRERRKRMTVDEFNAFDRRINRLIIAAANEPFLQHTLRPLHTIFRRIGWIYHTQIASETSLDSTIDCHLAVLDAVADRQVAAAMAASDALIDFVDRMFDQIEQQIDPALLDCSFEPLIGT
jgi:DNA-binding GntR family transcriptional regulator